MSPLHPFDQCPQGVIFEVKQLSLIDHMHMTPTHWMNCVRIWVLMHWYNDITQTYNYPEFCFNLQDDPSAKLNYFLGYQDCYLQHGSLSFLAFWCIYFNACWFTARMISCCSFTSVHLLCEYWSLYLASLSHASDNWCLMTKHYFVWLVTSCTVRHSIINKHQRWYKQRPVWFLLFIWSFK